MLHNILASTQMPFDSILFYSFNKYLLSVCLMPGIYSAKRNNIQFCTLNAPIFCG